jgi:signal transduction histidine kinase
MALLVLAWFQYRFLQSTRSATALALKGNLDQNAEAFSRRFEAIMAEIDRTAFGDFPESRSVQALMSNLKARFDQVHSHYPQIGSFFLLPDCDCDRNQRIIVADSSGARVVSERALSGDPEMRDLMRAAGSSSGDALTSNNHLEYSLVTHGCSCQRTVGHMPDMYLIHSKKLHGTAPNRAAVLAVALPSELLERRILSDISSELACPDVANAFGTAVSQVFFTVYNRDGLRVYSGSRSQAGTPVGTRASFGRVLPGWEVSAAYSGPDAEQMVSRQIRRSIIVFALSFLILGAGMLMIVRAISVELRNARARDDFVANVSHEMKTPLAVIHMFSETLELKRISTPEVAEEYQTIIRKQAERLTLLIDRLLEFVRATSTKRAYAFTLASIEKVVLSVLQEFRDLLQQGNFRVDISCERDLPAIKMDPEAMGQVIRNLLDNSIKYSDESRSITVRVFRKAGDVLVTICDRGIGISSKEQRNIFRKFYRVHTGMVHDVKGTGLGLSICERIIRDHKGRISVESSPGKGSMFTLHLPAYNG